MECPRCHYANADGARFCGECGASLTRDVTCAGCGQANPVGQKFCNGCGQPLGESAGAAERAPRAYTPKHLAEKILASKSALEGERKQVTVLFADVKGSMELAEHLDPEEWHGIMDRFFQLLAEGVHRFEGTVNQYTGDGMMALFGAPIAHEDHARRACYAALHLNEGLRRYADELRLSRGLSFSVRMGINSGEVVVGRIGDDLRMDYTAQGHTVGLAQRMEQLAEPGRVYLTGHTAQLVAGYFRLRDLGPLAVKGASEPVAVHELEGVGALRTRLDVSRARGFSRFVGRADEMAALEAALARAREGQGQVVGVVADAGVGKSRLCYEFAERCRARGLRIYETHCVAHGKMIPFLPVLELLRGYFGITEQDTDQVAREKIAGRLLLLDRELTEALPLVFDFLGIADPAEPPPRMDPEARQRQLFAAARRLIQVQSQREPGVVLVEDMHWVDGGSEAFFANHVEAVPGSRGVLVMNFRPEYHAAWMQKSYYQQLPLLPLGPEAAGELLRDLLGADPSLDGLAGRIGERTAGNPFFVEEIVQALVESGTLAGAKGAYRLTRLVEDVAIPATVQGILAARIDRLSEREKSVLQTAAVIGREFGETVLARVAELPAEELGAALRALEGAELVYEQVLFPEVEYAFKHPLTQEVAYRSQLADRRARVHAAVARAIAALYPEKLDERAALLAHHWEAAGDLLEAARWSGRAAEWAGTNDTAEALRHWGKVRTLLERVPESAETSALGLRARAMMLDIGFRLGMPEEEAATLFAEGRALGERSGDAALLAYLVSRYATVRGTAGCVEDYLGHAVESLRLAGKTDRNLELQLMVSAAHPHYLVGRLGDALRLIDTYLDSAGETPVPTFGGFNVHAFAVWFRSMLLFELGRIAEGRRQLERAERVARDGGETEVLGWVHAAHAMWAELTGEDESALAHARQSLEVALKIGSAFSQVIAYAVLGRVHLRRGEWGESVNASEQSLALGRERRTGVEQESSMLAVLAEAHLGRGDLSRARAAAEEAVETAQQRGTLLALPRAQLALARVLLRTEGAGARTEIEAALDRALTVARETGAKTHEPEVHIARAELARLTGDQAARRRELTQAQRLFTEMGATTRAEQVARELGSSVESTSAISSTSRT